MNVAVLGTGIMGAPIARNLLRAGHAVRAWNRTRARAEELLPEGAAVAGTPAAATEGVEVIVTMLADAAAVADAMLSGEGLAAAPSGALWLQMGTIGVAATEQLTLRADEAGVRFVDAPVLGSKAQAEEGALVALGGAREHARGPAEEILDPVAEKVIWLGDPPAGSQMKLIVNNWVICTVENLAEAFVLCERLGVDPRRFLESIDGRSFDMPYAHIKGAAMLSRTFPPGFPLEHARKDLRLVLEAAGDALELPATRVALRQLDRAVELGHGRDDFAATYHASAGGRPAPV